jgi:dihydroflavonol-4-reductase
VTALVTGASGFVGAAVVRALLERGETVRAFVRPTSDLANLAGLEVEIARGDLTDPPSLDRALAGVRHVFHVAAEYRLWHPRPRVLYAANVEGTSNVLRAAARAGVERVCYTSSVATLGRERDGRPADEATPARLEDMIGHYKRSKFLAEEVARRSAAEEGVDVVIVTPSTPVGPRDVKPTPTGRMVLDAAAGRMPAYVDTGLNVVHVDDVAAGHLLALAHGRSGERYVLGGENLSLRDILTRVAALAGRRPPRVKLRPEWLFPLAWGAQGWARVTRGAEPRITADGLRMARKPMYFSDARARRELGYAPRDAGEGLRDAVDWFRAVGRLA